MSPRKIILAGGGTGGHIYPALAIGKELKRIFPDSSIIFVGTRRGLERELVGKAGFPFTSIRVKGFNRKLSLDTLVSVKELVLGVFDSIKLLKSEKPDIIIGTGGYVAGPVIFFASLMGIPTFIHEQNVCPGVTNRILSRFVDRIAISFSDSTRYFPETKTVLTGNPVRTEITKGIRSKALKDFGLSPDLPVVLCFGGSQGAARINDAIIDVIDSVKNTKRFQVIHITGSRYYEKTKELLANKGINLSRIGHIIVRPYIYEMEDAYAAADLVICRAGAISIAELNACGKPAILIPFPNAANKHQDFNASFMEKSGAAVMIFESELSAEKLTKTINDIVFDKRKLGKMARSSKALAREDALKDILKEITKMVR